MLGSDYPQISLARMVEALEKLDLTNEEKRPSLVVTPAGYLALPEKRTEGEGAVKRSPSPRHARLRQLPLVAPLDVPGV
jgi:hypothetical protein